MTSPKPAARLDWRAELTPEERRTIEAADNARVEWEKLNAARAGIVNRAIQRAKYRNRAALKRGQE